MEPPLGQGITALIYHLALKFMSRLIRHDLRQLTKYAGLVGVDEAGRGALAGYVSAAAVWMDRSFFDSRQRRKIARRANDSKKMSPAAREDVHAALCEWQTQGVVRMAQTVSNVLEIDAYNILGATRLAMNRCFTALAESAGAEPSELFDVAGDEDTPLFRKDATLRPRVLIDGRPLRPFVWRHTALVGGDGRSLVIALASILAKVRRDNMMRELDQRYPQYGFAEHKGYGTAAHIDALRKHGPCEAHRPLFLRSILAAQPPGSGMQTEFEF
ncbi:MAG: ribonuclease HII [Puniceicoccales bacterium]|jgi:ribonuclease HII|nr:ribonuclease HII [Puniceicoccales bacterium]